MGRVWIFMHDQPDRATKGANGLPTDPRGVTLLNLVIGYLKGKNIAIGNPTGEPTYEPAPGCLEYIKALQPADFYKCPSQAQCQ